jgi:hypothetical protein
VLTPNSVEARRLAGASPSASLDECAARLIGRGAAYVLITGTHEPGAEGDQHTLRAGRGATAHRWQRLDGTYHGSGCTLASAIAAQLALGLPVPDAVHVAQEYTWHTLANGFRPAAGQHIPDRFSGRTRPGRGDPMTLRGLYAITPDDADASRLEDRVARCLPRPPQAAPHFSIGTRPRVRDCDWSRQRRLTLLARASGVPFISQR